LSRIVIGNLAIQIRVNSCNSWQRPVDFIQLNREFYDSFAAEFSGSRAAIQAGIRRALAMLDCASVLDVGCGDGRVSKVLPVNARYIGLDFSEKLIGRVAASPASFVLADVSGPLPIAAGAFPAVLCFAVLHHLPERESFMRELARVMKPGGRLALSVWQITHSGRMRKKIVHDLGGGDYVLSWERGGRGERFVHEVSEDEMKRLAHSASLSIVEMFRSDGRSNDLSLYAILEAR
jgi:SAM-dependent methyltransferase